MSAPNTNMSLPRAFAAAGRSQKPLRDKTCPRVTLRLTTAEYDQVKTWAGDGPVSSALRQRLFRDVPGLKARNGSALADQRALAQALALLGESRIANNLNQLAHQANMGVLRLDEQARGRLEESYDYITALRDLLIKALGLTKTR